MCIRDRGRAVKGGSLRDRFKAELGKGGDDKGSIDGADIKAYEAMRAAAGARQARRKNSSEAQKRQARKRTVVMGVRG